MNKCSMCEENMCWGIQRGELMKNLEEEINKIIITTKRKLYDANLESVNLIMGERKKDIKQAWQNGYNKAREEVVKEFAEKLKTELFANFVVIQAVINLQKEDMDSREVFQKIDELAEQFGKEEV